MNIFCSNSESSLTVDINFCPKCGVSISSYSSDSTAPSISASSLENPLQLPSTGYGSSPYDTTLSNAYEPLLPTPPPPLPPHQNKRLCVLIGINLLIVVIAGVSVFALLGLSAKNNATIPSSPALRGVCYQAHVQNIGWQSLFCDGAIAGTSGQNLCLEAIKINLVNAPPASHICYQAHVQNIGWQNQVCDGAIAGTTGQSLPLDAIQIVVSH